MARTSALRCCGPDRCSPSLSIAVQCGGATLIGGVVHRRLDDARGVLGGRPCQALHELRVALLSRVNSEVWEVAVKERFEGADGRRRLLDVLKEQKIVGGNESLAEAIAAEGELCDVPRDGVLIEQDATDTDLFL